LPLEDFSTRPSPPSCLQRFLSLRDSLWGKRENREPVFKRMNTKRLFLLLLILVLTRWSPAGAAPKDLDVQGKRLVSQKPPFTVTLPSEIVLVDSFSHESPERSSLTRVYFLVRAKEKQVEEMLILQIADRTNPQAGPINAGPLKPYAEKRLYSKGRMKKGESDLDYLIQSIAWNPKSPSLQPILKKGFIIPLHWALQGQFLFLFQADHAVFFRYSKDADSFGMKISEKGEDWGKGVISRNEKKAYETFQKSFMQMIDSLQINLK